MPGTPDLSVVIPTRDRLGALTRTLDSIGAQDTGGALVEVIVADNGSSDGTPDAVREMEGGFPLELTTVIEPNGGAAAARNAGVAQASGRIVLFLGDDTPAADSTLVAGHIDAHADDDPHLGVLGLCSWSPDLPVTPVMRWLERTGKSHDYSRLVPGEESEVVVYSNNFSIPRLALLEVDGFDERFPACNWEDYELGLRLADRGLRVVYRPDLAVHHDHAYDLESSLARMRSVGRSARLVETIHPERPDLRTPRLDASKAWASRIMAPGLAALGLRGDTFMRAAHYGELERGYKADPIAADPSLRGGISHR